MLKKLPLTLLLAFSLSSAALADEASKKEKLDRFVEAIGLKQSFAESIAAQREQTKKAVEPTMRQILDDSLAQDPAIRARFEKVFHDYLDTAMSAYNAEQMSASYGALLGKHLSEGDIEELLKFYTSDLGRKEVAATRQALAEYAQTTGVERQARLSKALSELRQQLGKIMIEAREKPAAAPTPPPK